ncbi:Uroporphyrin-III c-methyltransferase [Mycena indigotica]|uniref:precorrin-2 dehydrogenase n=1 Tax=Mycena indigotica TaxID=2126181 RepID=A0A8H6T0B0_9AGAR|nr:Uroporphyrin-III c-methyltransferase [Mycena indigotica]KAF7307587.1 Uroporphyrin-III c-methyltransferase [Mycena indigotica]
MHFPSPQGGASLILSFHLQTRTTLIIGSGTLAASRAFAALEADSNVLIVARGGTEAVCQELKWRAEQGQLEVVDWDGEHEDTLESYLASTKHNISLVCVTDTLIGPERRSRESAQRIYRLCRARGIPVNTTDMPDLCDFSFCAAHRFTTTDEKRSALQIGVTTNGRGCRLASRVKREIVGLLQKELGAAVEMVGVMRKLAAGNRDESCEEPVTPNEPVSPRTAIAETEVETAARRMKWVAQVSEYWPIPRLATMNEQDMQAVLSGEFSDHVPKPTIHDLSNPPPIGRIFLVGSGPGHPSLLTVAAHRLLTTIPDLVLSDKLVPSAVLALIPPTVEVRIARKFPGNADGAQSEMMEAAVEAAHKGLTVVRLKQGDPVLYGRAGEEILYFRARGFEPVVVPGVSSALAGPTFAGIPVTQRGVADALSVCTGVGRAGKAGSIPIYERAKTVVLLMGIARLASLVETMLIKYPANVPVAIVERASMPDQRVLVSTLQHVVAALDSLGEQRPPGILIVGWAVLALWGPGDDSVLDEGADAEDSSRIRRWLGSDVDWRVTEGLPNGWDSL